MLVWACLIGLLIIVKVKIDNKEAYAQLAIKGHYLRQLQSILKPFFYHIDRSERLPLLSAQDGCYLLGTVVKHGSSFNMAQKFSGLACFLSV